MNGFLTWQAIVMLIIGVLASGWIMSTVSGLKSKVA